MTRNTIAMERDVLACVLEDATNIAETGGKAYNLGRMVRLGLNVPRGFVLKTAAFHQFLAANRLEDLILEIQNNGSPDIHSVATTVRELVMKSAVPEEILDCVLEMRRQYLADSPLIVRSSAVGEDGGTASFAGQLDSIPDVRNSADLEQALLQCWSSYWNERLLFYQKAKGIHLRGMGVVFQVQVDSRFSGVLFTSAPEPVFGDQLYAEYCAGPGEALVSGRLTPGRINISRTDYRCLPIQAFEGDHNAPEQVPLTNGQIEELAKGSVLLEEHFGSAQDIEWTIDPDGKLFFLQSRPITVAARRSGVLWSNANVNENFPDAITPFLYSIARDGYYHYFRNLALAFGVARRRVDRMEQSFRHIIGVHHSRMYYNLTSIHSVLQQAPFGTTLARFFNQFVGATEFASTTEQQDLPRWQQALEVMTIGLKTVRQYLFFARRVRQFEEQADRFADSTKPHELPTRSLIELRDDLRRFLDIRCHRWTNASLADAAAMVTYGLLEWLLKSAYPAGSHSALHNNLLKGLTGIASVRPTLLLWEISRTMLRDPELVRRFVQTASSRIPGEILDDPAYAWLRRALDEYLEAWGYRFSGELMLTVPSFQENEAPLLDLLKTYLQAGGGSPAQAIEQLESQRLAETRRILDDLKHNRRLPYVPRRLQGTLLRVLLRATRCSIQMRERARAKQALLYSRCRRIALAIGSQLTTAGFLEHTEDVFFMTSAELDDLLSGYAMFPFAHQRQIAIRKESQLEAQLLHAPDTFFMAEGEYCRNTSLETADAELDAAAELRGIGACGGKAAAPAAILESVEQSHLLRQGDILVTRQTDPGWGPVFFLIRGLVIERGGMLSHGAIIAREFGLPCVVGVKDATRRIAQRCPIVVDGDRGYVHILD